MNVSLLIHGNDLAFLFVLVDLTPYCTVLYYTVTALSLYSLIVHDVVEPMSLEVDQIYHLACPASPPHYQYNPVKTIKTSTMGTINMLGLAKRTKAKILLTSTR